MAPLDAPPKPDIAAEIRERIAAGALALGGRISDKALAEELNVSRTPVREALLQLQIDGLVVMKPQSGTFVFDPADADIEAICAARTVIESGAVRIAVGEDSGAALGALARLIGQAAVALDEGDLEECDRLDCSFHETLVAATGNTYLIQAYGGLSCTLRALRRRMPRNRDRIAAAIAQHRRITDLWAANRAEQAVDEITAHVSNVERLLCGVEASGRVVPV